MVSTVDKAIKPVTGMMDMVINFFKNILLGSAVNGFNKILENPEIIMKPLRDFTNGIIDFINLFNKRYKQIYFRSYQFCCSRFIRWIAIYS